MNTLIVKWLPIQKINPAAYNPRRISDEALSGLKESIKKFGFVEPLVINTKTGNLVGGHQRLKAAENLGMKTVPIVEVKLSLAEEKALNISLNNPQISGEYTEGLLPLIQEIKLAGIDLAPLRIDALEIDLPDIEQSEEKKPNIKDVFDDQTESFIVQIEASSESELQDLFEEFNSRGLNCRILNL